MTVGVSDSHRSAFDAVKHRIAGEKDGTLNFPGQDALQRKGIEHAIKSLHQEKRGALRSLEDDVAETVIPKTVEAMRRHREGVRSGHDPRIRSSPLQECVIDRLKCDASIWPLQTPVDVVEGVLRLRSGR